MTRRDRLVRGQLRERFLVTIDSEESFEGVLIDVDDAHYVLADAEQVSAGGPRLRIDGHLWLPRVNVRYLQKP